MSDKLPPNIELGTLKLKVSHLERSLQFYQNIVGFKILRKSDSIAELTVDGIHTLLELEEIPNAVSVPPRTMSGLYHFALLLPTRKDLGVALKRLIDASIHIGQADHLVSEALYISDPDHHGIEIYRDRPRHTWKRDAKGEFIMASDPLDWEELLNEAKGHEWNGLPSETVLGHVHFHIKDLQKSKQFYCDILGFDIASDVSRQMGALFISAGGYHHHIGLNVWAGSNAPTPSSDAASLAYYSLVMPNRSELDHALSRLKNANIPVKYAENVWYVKDPSDIELRLTISS